VEVPGHCPLVLLVNVDREHFEDWAKVLFCPLLTDVRKSIGFCKVSRLRSFVLLVRETRRWRIIVKHWWNDTDRGKSGVLVEWYWQGKEWSTAGMSINVQHGAAICRLLFSVTLLDMFRVSCNHHQEY
jgi:hypothetical protein